MVPESDQLPAEMAQVDALATACRLAAVGQQRDAQRIRPWHGDPFLIPARKGTGTVKDDLSLRTLPFSRSRRPEV
ncbi:hypothetical protein GCM10010140_35090 [Streptosporangium pseudovulgare]|uniref:Uncharacterized protein n=1 Tax=Streptosporangium pseudovulgare TaxID=35765 RepID=A0ABQ2R053_9ACTN|nr:hypothetical protein GCM10010140_35090 [Streptosporangium pseudovulgare]